MQQQLNQHKLGLTLKATALATALAMGSGAAFAQDNGAGGPLPTCDASDNSYYMLEWLEKGTEVSLTEIKLGDYSSNPVTHELWKGPAPATVAADMAKDGYIYGISGWGLHNGTGLIKYGINGDEGVRAITYGATGLGGAVGDPIEAKFGISNERNNFNAAAFATSGPYQGQLIAGSLYAGQVFDDKSTPTDQTLLVIDPATAQLTALIELTADNKIPQTTGDFAISADGTTIYGGSYGTPTWWQLDLTSGTLTQQPLAAGAAGSYGGAARLPNGDYAFDQKSTVDIFDASGNPVKLGLSYAGNGGSQDAAVCRVTPSPTPIPTLSQWGLLLMGLGIGGMAWLRRRRLGD